MFDDFKVAAEELVDVFVKNIPENLPLVFMLVGLFGFIVSFVAFTYFWAKDWVFFAVFVLIMLQSILMLAFGRMMQKIK